MSKPYSDEELALKDAQRMMRELQTGAISEEDRFLATIAADRKRIEDMFEIGRGQEAEIIELQARIALAKGANDV